MGVIVDQLIAAGYPGYAGWGDAEAAANFAATNGAGKESSSGGNAPGSMPKFEFDQAAAEKAAMEELRPYYEKLLKIYNGDVNLAKKRMEEDYSRGLRYKQSDTQTGLQDIEATKAERDRKFKIALGDLDQEMNTRGLYTSGIRTQERAEATADETRQKALLDQQARDLAESEKRYVEGADVEKQRFLEEKGFAPTGVEGYMSEPEKQKWDQAQKMTEQSRAMATEKRSQKFNDWQYGVTPLATANPTNYTEVLNNALTMQGLQPIKT
jgi:hypothetical protein